MSEKKTEGCRCTTKLDGRARMTKPHHCDTPAHRQSSHHVTDDACSPTGPQSGASSHEDEALPDVAKIPFVPPVVTTSPSKSPSITGEAARQGRPTQKAPAEPDPTGNESGPRQHSRRDVIRRGSKLAFTAPIISTFYASQAYAANYSCYAEGHSCEGAEPCCGDLSCNGGECSPYCVETGDLCFTDADCCSSKCNNGTCRGN